MKSLIGSTLAFLFFVLIGCATQQPVTTGQPEAVSLTQLPPLETTEDILNLEVHAIFLVNQDGTVEDVRIMNSTEGTEWNTAAIDSLKKWRFAELTDQENLWFSRVIKAENVDPVYMTLGELVTYSQAEADSLHALLRSGVDFRTLATQTRENNEETELGRYIGTTDVTLYPKHIRQELVKLKANQYSKPIKVGNNYVIYKRFHQNLSDNGMW